MTFMHELQRLKRETASLSKEVARQTHELARYTAALQSIAHSVTNNTNFEARRLQQVAERALEGENVAVGKVYCRDKSCWVVRSNCPCSNRPSELVGGRCA